MKVYLWTFFAFFFTFWRISWHILLIKCDCHIFYKKNKTIKLKLFGFSTLCYNLKQVKIKTLNRFENTTQLFPNFFSLHGPLKIFYCSARLKILIFIGIRGLFELVSQTFGGPHSRNWESLIYLNLVKSGSG
jgi:hypothetical protein